MLFGSWKLVEWDGNIYYVLHSGKIAVDSTRVISEELAAGLVEAGEYYFDAEGKLVIPEEPEEPEPEHSMGLE